MSNDNIISLVGKTETEENNPPTLDELLEELKKDVELEECIIIGIPKGEEEGLVLASNLPGMGAINLMLDTAKLSLLTGA